MLVTEAVAVTKKCPVMTGMRAAMCEGSNCMAWRLFDQTYDIRLKSFSHTPTGSENEITLYYCGESGKPVADETCVCISVDKPAETKTQKMNEQKPAPKKKKTPKKKPATKRTRKT